MLRQTGTTLGTEIRAGHEPELRPRLGPTPQGRPRFPVRPLGSFLLLAAGFACVSLAPSALAQHGQHPTGDPLLDPGSLGREPGTRVGGSSAGSPLGGGSTPTTPLAPPGNGAPPDGAGGTGGSGAGSGGPIVPGGGAGIPGTQPPLGPVVAATASFDLLGDEAQPWELWWDLNRHRYVDARADARAATTTGSADFFLGTGESLDAPVATRSLPTDLLPTLLLAASDSDPRLAAEGLLALGELSERFAGDPDAHISIRAVLASRATDPSLFVADAAVQALAIGAGDGDLSLLAALLLDEPVGREFQGGGEVSPIRRGYAALGLGRLGATTAREDVRRLAAHYLIRGYESAPRNRQDLAATCLVAMAQIPLERTGLRDPGGIPEPPNYSRLALLRYLVGLVENRRRLDDTVLAHLPSAVAIAASGLSRDERDELSSGLAAPLLDVLERPRREPDTFVRHAALAAGALGDWDDDRVDDELRDALIELFDAADAHTRACAMLGLGSMLGNPGSTAPGEGFGKASEALLEVVTRGSAADRPSAAIALGVAGAALRDHGELVPSRWVITIRAALVQAKSAQERVALCLAAGLLGDTGAESAIVGAYERVAEKRDRSRIAVALGLLGSREAIKRLRDDLDGDLADRIATRRTAEASALCGDVNVAARLTAMLQASSSRVANISLLDAMAEVGDDDLLPLLIEQVGDENVDSGQRSRAVRAIARIADGEDLPWIAPYTALVTVPGAAAALFVGDGTGALERLP
ncbi:HEAT repeat domain-containing protein [Engelhardtia mirabilis]|uniref:HEAT repeat protein n=1 Tax=Engelhardtia mirabilis TaxID=2528011 RepID=A0A518BKT2_9BACT|nr:hypothetical protein Pla133_26410 [Planctomycetes bacterium Pla133]QDV01879.1 hypothetical protein Pla86_26400 [Planctomycetes bacterium Pla86]